MEAASALALELQVFVGLKLVSSALEVGLVQAETEMALLEAAAAAPELELQVFVGLKPASSAPEVGLVQAETETALLEAAASAPELQVFVGSEPVSSVLAEVLALLEAVASAGELQVSVGLGPVSGGRGAEWAPSVAVAAVAVAAAVAAAAVAVKATPPAVAAGTGRRAAETVADRRLQADPARTTELEHSRTMTLARRTAPQASHRYRTTEHTTGY